MSIQRLPSGRLRVQVYDPHTGRNVSVAKVLGLPRGTTWPDSKEGRRAAKKAREDARERLYNGPGPTDAITLLEFWERWTSDPLFARAKESTNIHNRERTKAFVAAHGALPIARVGDAEVSAWLAGGKRNGTVPALRAMFNDALSVKGGRVVRQNPFAKLGISRGPGNRFKRPPSLEETWAMIRAARRVTAPSFAAWLQFAAFTGMRPGEIDGLRWESIDMATGVIDVKEQWNAISRSFTLPKNGERRKAVLTPPAREALLAMPREASDAPFVFLTTRRTHYSPSSRASSWRATRAAAGVTCTLYLATRHFAGSYMRNQLGLDAEDIAKALGHTDGGELVRTLYGHHDTDLALDRVRAAFERIGNSNVVPLRRVEGDGA